jgi:hypothetical protein
LGLTLDERNCDLREADFDTGSGSLRLVGGLILDGARVRCIAELDLATLAGMGNLEVVERPPSDDFQQA